MKKLLTSLTFLVFTATCCAQIIDKSLSGTTACNAPAESCGYFVNGSPAVGELLIISAWWANPAATAILTDNTMTNTYSVLGSGVVNLSGSLVRAQTWFAINRGNLTGWSVKINGLSQPGGFNGIYFQVTGITGEDRLNPIDLKTYATATGKGMLMRVTSGAPSGANSSNEMMLAQFLTQGSGTPFGYCGGWTPLFAGEAVSATEYMIGQSVALTATASSARNTDWVGFIFGIRRSTLF